MQEHETCLSFGPVAVLVISPLKQEGRQWFRAHPNISPATRPQPIACADEFSSSPRKMIRKRRKMIESFISVSVGCFVIAKCRGLKGYLWVENNQTLANLSEGGYSVTADHNNVIYCEFLEDMRLN